MSNPELKFGIAIPQQYPKLPVDIRMLQGFLRNTEAPEASEAEPQNQIWRF